MALGWVFLDVAANPLAASLGPDDRFVWRINLAQAVFPVGTILAISTEKWLLGPHVIWGARFTFSAAHPLALLGGAVLLIAWVFDEKKFPAVAIERSSVKIGAALRSLLSDWRILLAMAAQGAGIIILIANGSTGGRYLVATFGVDEIGPLGNVFFWAALIFAAGRLAGCGLMRFVSPARLLAVFAIAGCVCSLVVAIGSPHYAGFAILAIQFFGAITWPTILGLAIRGRGPFMKVATALVCMGGAMGANLYVVSFTVWPSLSPELGMMLPAMCFAVVFGFALAFRRGNAAAPAGVEAPEPQAI